MFTRSASAKPSRKYIETVFMQGIKDIFSAQELWERPSPFSWGGSQRLKSIINASSYRMGRQRRVFNHVVIELPAEELKYDRVANRGAQAQALIAELSETMVNDFGQRLGNERPRIAIHADTDLSADCARVKIGPGVYVGGADNMPQWRIEYSFEGLIWKEIAEIMHDQRLLVVGGDAAHASAVLADWQFDNSVVLRIFNDEDDVSKLTVDAAPSEMISVSSGNSPNVRVVSDGTTTVYLRIIPLNIPHAGAEKERPRKILVSNYSGHHKHAVSGGDIPTPEAGDETYSGDWGVKAYQQATDDEPTYIPEVGGMTTGQHTMSVVGIALQRVSIYPKINQLSFGFDAQARVVPIGDGHEEWLVGLSVDSTDHVELVSRHGRRLVETGEDIHVPQIGKTFRFDTVSRQMESRYVGICSLPATLSEPIGVGARFTAGRNQKFLKGLRVLSGSGFVSFGTASNCAGGDNMGVSRKAFMCEVMPNKGLMVTPLSALPLFHLGEHMNFCQILEAEQQKGYLIPSGHHLVAGHYLLRYAF